MLDVSHGRPTSVYIYMYLTTSNILQHSVATRNSYMPLLRVHEMYGRIQGHVTILLAHDPLSSSSTYPMIIHTHHIAGNLPKKTL